MHIQFVCWGNICRSPMGERVARRIADERGLDIEISSSGVSSEELGNPIDRRARALLTSEGYDADGHRARKVTREIASDVDLFIVAEQYHGERLNALGIGWDRIRLVTDYDEQAMPGDPLPDPWYGGPEDFEETLAVLERAIPRLLDEVSK